MLPVWVFIGIFLVLPVVLMAVYSFLTKEFRGGVIWEFTFAAYDQFFLDRGLFGDDPPTIEWTYIGIFWRSIWQAGLATVLCLLIGWRGNPVLHSLVLAVVAGRLVWEQLPGYDVDYLRAWINGRVYVNAHLYGALSGALLAVAMLLVAGRRRTTLGRRSDIC